MLTEAVVTPWLSISTATADALNAEARRRSEAGEFFGHIAYVSLIGRKP